MIFSAYKIGTASFLIAVLVFLSACSKGDDGLSPDISTDGTSYKTIKVTANHVYRSQGILTDKPASFTNVKIYSNAQDRQFDNNAVRTATTDSLGKFTFGGLTDSLYYIQATYAGKELYENVDFNTAGELLFLELDFYIQ